LNSVAVTASCHASLVKQTGAVSPFTHQPYRKKRAFGDSYDTICRQIGDFIKRSAAAIRLIDDDK
jgi:hypothetical protein